MSSLFDVNLRALRRDRAARAGPELFLLNRVFEDCIERIMLLERQFGRALLIGCPDPNWPNRLRAISPRVDVRDPGSLFAAAAEGQTIIEDEWEAEGGSFDLVLSIGTLDTVNDLPLALRLIRHSMRSKALFIGAISGSNTLPRLRAAMRAADAVSGAAAPHIHPRIEPSALAPLLENAGFLSPVVDVERMEVSYSSLGRLIEDLRGMGATNILNSRPRALTRLQYEAAVLEFASAREGTRPIETFELIHFAAWNAGPDDDALTL